MKKIFYLLFAALSTAIGLSSCESIVYDGEYSKDGFYHGQNNVYFYYQDPADTLLEYSFGAQPESYTKHTIEVPVRLAGMPSKNVQHFKVCVGSASTAKVGIHYEALQSEYEIPADSVNATIPVVFLRDSMSVEKGSYTLVLHMEGTNELGDRYPTNNTIKIRVSNVLEEPEIWKHYPGYFGDFERKKYLMMLSYYDSSEIKFWTALMEDSNRVFLNFMKVYNALKADPTYKYKDLLPASPYNPYQP